jgi:hypothetical protein
VEGKVHGTSEILLQQDPEVLRNIMKSLNQDCGCPDRDVVGDI